MCSLSPKSVIIRNNLKKRMFRELVPNPFPNTVSSRNGALSKCHFFKKWYLWFYIFFWVWIRIGRIWESSGLNQPGREGKHQRTIRITFKQGLKSKPKKGPGIMLTRGPFFMTTAAVDKCYFVKQMVFVVLSHVLWLRKKEYHNLLVWIRISTIGGFPE